MKPPTSRLLLAAGTVLCAAALLAPAGSAATAPAPAVQAADGDPVSIGTWRSLESEVLGESRKLMISLPPGHEVGDARYPVLYLLDGDSHFTHTVGLLRFLESTAEAPPTIVVGIPNTDRTRDLTPPTAAGKDDFPTAGGVDDFLRFLRDEVFPWIEVEYRGSRHRTLVGHSFGGLTAIYALVHHPEDYAAYLAISPSLWWDEQRLVAQATAAFADAEPRETGLYMTLGSEDSDMRGGFRRMEALLSEGAPAGLRWDSRVLPDENHMSVPYRSTLLGLRFLYHDWALPELTTDFLASGWSGVTAAYEASAERYGTPRALDDMSLVLLATALMDAGRLSQALDALDSAPLPLLAPAVAYEMIGMSAKADGNQAAAQRAFLAALRLNPGSQSLREDLRAAGGDPDQVPPPQPVDAEEAAAYIGLYEGELDGEQESVTVSYTDGRLVATFGDGPVPALQRIAGDRFQLFDGYLQLEFRRDDGGAVVALMAKVPGQDLAELRRVARQPQR